MLPFGASCDLRPLGQVPEQRRATRGKPELRELLWRIRPGRTVDAPNPGKSTVWKTIGTTALEQEAVPWAADYPPALFQSRSQYKTVYTSKRSGLPAHRAQAGLDRHTDRRRLISSLPAIQPPEQEVRLARRQSSRGNSRSSASARAKSKPAARSGATARSVREKGYRDDEKDSRSRSGKLCSESSSRAAMTSVPFLRGPLSGTCKIHGALAGTRIMVLAVKLCSRLDGSPPCP